MKHFFSAFVDTTGWLIATGWKFWSALFSTLPYGDPYIATAVALVIGYMTYRVFNPDNQTY